MCILGKFQKYVQLYNNKDTSGDTSGDTKSSSFNLTHKVENAQTNTNLALVRQELGSGKSKTGRNDSLDGGIVGQVQEEAHVLHGTVLLEVLLEETGCLHVHTHSGEHDGEVIFMVIEDRLARDLDRTKMVLSNL